MIECVPNVSEGRRASIVAQLGRACGSALLDVHTDADHHRSVFTLAGPEPTDAIAAVRSLARAVAQNINIHSGSGVHPRLGALDVVPFIALSDTADEHDVARLAANAFAQWWSSSFGVPCFLYDAATAGAPTLPDVRRAAFRDLDPDFGGAVHPTLGATAVGVRPPLVALNLVLVSNDLARARTIATTMRAMPGVRSMAFALAERNQVQVSMNLIDLATIGVEAAATEVRALARRAGNDIAEVELVGLVPAAEARRWSSEFIAWSRIESSATIEARAKRARPR